MSVVEELQLSEQRAPVPGPKVLVVEDDEVDFRAIHRLLRQVFDGDLLVDWARTGTDAIARSFEDYEVFIVDQFLGGETGVELVKVLQDRLGRRVYILVTGVANPEIDRAAVASGFSSFLVKSGLSADDLERAIRYGTEAIRREEDLAERSAELLRAKRALEQEVEHHRRTTEQLRETHRDLEAALRAAEENEQRYRQLSELDLLTGLANRRSFSATLEQEIERSRRSGRLMSLLFLDLDGFKSINDTLGHSAGDQLLAAIGSRLSRVIRKTDMAARFGGDEFAVILTNLSDRTAIAGIAQKIIAALREPIEIDGQRLTIGVSVGIAICEDGQTTSASMLREADTALYQAKGAGGCSFRFFGQDLDRLMQRHKRIESDLSAAVRGGVLSLAYQPKISLVTGKVIGLEALSRWRHPVFGVIAPTEFIDVAERSGQISAVTRFVIEASCRQIASWVGRGRHPVPVAINLSPRDFDSDGVFEAVRDSVGHFGIDPSLLEVEITEQTTVPVIKRAMRQLDRLKSIGVTVAIDDFGTGLSTFSLVKVLPIDRIKLDRSFVHGLLKDPKDRSIARAVSRLAESLSIAAIAEGIETFEQAAALSSIGFAEGQGFLFARPTSAERLERWYGDYLPAKYCYTRQR